MNLTCQPFGPLSDGRETVLYTVTNSSGVCFQCSNFGCALVSLWVPDRSGQLVDVVLGCGCAADYELQTACVGCVPGRHANRIAKGEFTLNGVTYHLAVNNGDNHLHGGLVGFDKRLWNHTPLEDGVVFSYLSPDGEEGYPGNLLATVTYRLGEDNRLSILYRCLCDQDTVVNLTNHSYFNLSGQGSGTVLDQQLKIRAEQFALADSQCLATGALCPVEGTPMDFREFHPIGQRIGEDHPQLRNAGGYDHNFVLPDAAGAQPQEFAQAYSPKTGIRLTGWTTQPGVQLYTANFLQNGGVRGKGGASYPRFGGFCLETQHFPNAMANPHFPSVVLRAGELYQQETWYGFDLVH